MDMHYSHRVHFADEYGLPDDIDCLFELLPHVAPPASLIKQILEQTPIAYAYDAFSVVQPLYLHDRPAVKRLTMAAHDMEHKPNHLC